MAKQTRKTTAPQIEAEEIEPAGEGRSVGRRICLVLGILIVLGGVIALSAPFLTQPIVGEEGYFAYLAVNDGRPVKLDNRKFLIIARLRDQVFFDRTSHPAPPYLFISHVLRSLSDGTRFASLSPNQKTVLARSRFLLTYCVAIALFCATALWGLWKARPGQIAIVLGLSAFAISTPLLVGGSIKPQIDGAVGVLLVCVVGFLVFAGTKVGPSRAGHVLLVLGGAFAGLGKNEWALAFLAALATAAGLKAYLRRANKKSPSVLEPRTLFYLSLGLAAGTVISFLVDPSNYLSGFGLMPHFQKQATQSGITWAGTFLKRLPMIWPLLPLLILSSAALLANWRDVVVRRPALLIMFFWMWAVSAGFLLSKWDAGGARYFCPPMAAALFTVSLAEMAYPSSRRWLAAKLPLILIGIAANLLVLRGTFVDWRPVGELSGETCVDELTMLSAGYEQARGTKQIAITDIPFVYYFPDIDFVSDQVSPEWRADIMRQARERLAAGKGMHGQKPQPQK